mgnify:CR=1 FL=1
MAATALSHLIINGLHDFHGLILVNADNALMLAVSLLVPRLHRIGDYAGGIVLVWPFDSIVVLTIVSGVSLVILGVIQIVQAFQIRKDTKTARDTVQALHEQVAA